MTTATSADGILVLNSDETREALGLPEMLDAVRAAFVSISDGTVSAPPRVAARSESGVLGAMPGYVPGLGLAAKVVTIFAEAHDGRTAHRGIVAYFDPDTGRPLAMMDAEAITALRTAAVATVAMQALARTDARRATIIGTGTQARAQLMIAEELGFRTTVCGRDRGRAEALAARFEHATSAPSEEGVRDADVVFCCTSSRTPVIDVSWLSPGTHVSSVGGSDGPEVDVDSLDRYRLFAEWSGAATEPPPAGAWELQGIDPRRIALVGDVLTGRIPGRTSPNELTLFKSTGHAAFDVAAAAVVYRAATAAQIGTMLAL